MSEENKAIIRVRHCTLDLKTGETKERELKGEELEEWVKNNMKREANNDNSNI